MNPLSLSVSKPSKANGIRSCIALRTSVSSSCSRTSNGAHSVQPVAISVSVSVCTKLPFAVGPVCATRSASTNPGGGSSQPSKVRTATLRRIAAEGGAWRRFCPPARSLTSRSARSIVAALIPSKPVRTSGARCRWPCRSIASIRIATSGRSRLPQTRSDAYQITINPRGWHHYISDAPAEGRTADWPARRGADASRACDASHSQRRIRPGSVLVPSGCQKRTVLTAQPPARLVSSC